MPAIHVSDLVVVAFTRAITGPLGAQPAVQRPVVMSQRWTRRTLLPMGHAAVGLAPERAVMAERLRAGCDHTLSNGLDAAARPSRGFGAVLVERRAACLGAGGIAIDLHARW